jgi:predicted porin
MKLKNKIFTIAATASISTLAHAQSSVTLYGIIDAGINYVSNAGGGRQIALTSGVNNGSRFGLRGSEDLGGGLKAIFQLENGFDVSSGKLQQGGLMFGRQAFVGLSNNVGSLTLGRQYDSVVDYMGQFAASDQWGGNIGAHPGDLDNFNNTYRVNNSLKFRSSTYHGFSVEGVYGLGGVAGDVSRNQAWSLGAGFSSGPLALGVAYLDVRNPNLSFFGNSSQTPLTAATANATSPVFSGYLSARSYQVLGAGGAYTLGNATISTTYSNIRFGGLGDLSSGPNSNHYSGTAAFNNVEAALRYQLTPAWLLGMAYDYTDGRGANAIGSAVYQQGEVSAQYFVSVRTVLYVMAEYQHAAGTDSRNKPAVAAINQITASSSNSQTLVRIGLRHKF